MKKHPGKLTLIIAAAACIAVLSLTVGVTLAYLGHSDVRNNTVNVGYGNTKLKEVFTEPDELSMVNPDIQKKISIQNTSSVPAFTRVYAEFTDSDLAGHASVKYTKNDNTNTTVACTWDQFKEKLKYTNSSFDSDWRYVPEGDANGLGGYFYYSKVLAASAETPQLFDSVTIDYQGYNGNTVIDSSNTDRIVPLEMIVYSELVQAKETGAYDDNGTTVYGHTYGNNEWIAVWRSFLKLT